MSTSAFPAARPGLAAGSPHGAPSLADATRWWTLDSGAGAPAWNMALDEALLEAAAALGQPLLRFYSWTEAAATFGYSQRVQEIERWTELRPLIRRPTGGGLVPHAADWTYSFVVPVGHWWYGLRARESYAAIHGWIREAFAGLNLPAVLARAGRTEAPGRCFAGAEAADILWQDRKIAGAAQRRNRLGLLIQGSIQPAGTGLDRRRFEEMFRQVGSRLWSVTWQPWPLSEQVRHRAEELRGTRYEREEYNRGR